MAGLLEMSEMSGDGSEMSGDGSEMSGDVRGRFCGRCLSADLGKSKEIIRPKS